MATPSLIIITSDPWTNNTDKWVLVYASYGVPVNNNIELSDTGNRMYRIDLGTVTTDATAYPYAYTSPAKRIILIPPGFTITNHVHAFGLCGYLEDLRGYF